MFLSFVCFSSVPLDIYVHYGQRKASTTAEIQDRDIVLTTFGTLMSEYKRDSNGPMFQTKWLRVVLDEGHLVNKYHFYGWYYTCRSGISNSNVYNGHSLTKLESAGLIKRNKSLWLPQNRIKSALVTLKNEISCEFWLWRGPENNIRLTTCWSRVWDPCF